MNLNSDFGVRAAVHAARLDWTPSPIPGVDRRMLDRIGTRRRAPPRSSASPAQPFLLHTHGGGEEFLVLDGVFQDEHGDYSAGSDVRNPPTSSHIPRSEPGCTIFVKLWQFDPDDRTPVRIDTSATFAPALDFQGSNLQCCTRAPGSLFCWNAGRPASASKYLFPTGSSCSFWTAAFRRAARSSPDTPG